MGEGLYFKMLFFLMWDFLLLNLLFLSSSLLHLPSLLHGASDCPQVQTLVSFLSVYMLESFFIEILFCGLLQGHLDKFWNVLTMRGKNLWQSKLCAP